MTPGEGRASESAPSYSHETYHVTTEDGYILQLVRILPLQSSPARRLPVLLMHGVLSCSDTWVSRGKSQDLAFIMTDMGYDVWLGDLRGNPYTKHHKFLSPHDPRFWDFSFHEHGVYDLPAMVDFILMKSGEPRLTYVGHSMGTTVFFVFASARPEYNKKISAAVLLAPVAAKFPFEEIHNPAMRLLLTQFSVLYDTLKSAGIVEILPRTPRLVYNVRKFCTHPPEQDYCLDFVGQFYGEHRANLDRTNCALKLAHFPAGASLKTFHHLGQIFNHGFRQYDYGQKMNRLKYNSTVPPDYPIHQITAPVLMMHGKNDPWTSDYVSLPWLLCKLGIGQIPYSSRTYGKSLISLKNQLVFYSYCQILKF
ncbi:unnamed protein product [Nesidiocoris tenuis]|uniref:AB hydrolase-1 domain-containing protein n=1 Tax=Nesidiocoris tenuis TaxID=355587 RepID=A0A6H5HC27_9HEMI|nr:unnamed protein product [Nesidiocoris tenuis]